ncbi:Pentatricopeptide repeat-containing protein [Vitis vinifera]|uniref:Pentatricopeptide repeat-containing protein n=1 Tax=Vitis vinifera TaxID=29760 RepID=A0A438ELR1_VITVI|nr:Pentatricopeptide repeat-containing protein [Vitis vinifera]
MPLKHSLWHPGNSWGTSAENDKTITFSKCLVFRPFGISIAKMPEMQGTATRKQVHAMLLASRIDMNILSMSSKLVGMYASCGDLQSARLVLERTQNPNVFAFNWMVSALAFHGYHEEAIGYLSLMQELGIVANKFTFSIVLKQCVGLMDFNKGREVHCVISRTGFGNVFLDVVSWTSMICGYCNIGTLEEALVLFERMKVEGLEPNDFTWNAMIAGYARDGDCNGAFVLFSRMVREGLVPDLVTWNAMISGFTQSLKAVEAWRLFQDMMVAGIKPNQVTVTGLLPACGLMGSIHRGKELHGLIYRMGFDMNVFVATALIDVYSKCGTVKDAWDVFDRIPIKNVASWNAMIGCYGKHGLVDSSIQLFERMQAEGMQANHITLISVLSACSHGGLVEKGLTIFRSMKEKYGVEISQEHYSCVLDLLCRSGRMVEAYELFKEMPIEVTDSIVGAFFNGCKIHGRRDLAKLMAEDILRMELKRPGGFVTLSNIYAADGEWEEVENIRKVMKEQGSIRSLVLVGLRRGRILTVVTLLGISGTPTAGANSETVI